jgi:hypothetical protein
VVTPSGASLFLSIHKNGASKCISIEIMGYNLLMNMTCLKLMASYETQQEVNMKLPFYYE